MTYGLKEDTINKIHSVFILFPEIEKVLIYGSRAKGNFRNGSDIDLTLFGHNLDYILLNKIKSLLDDLNTPYLIDISIYDKIKSDELLDHINRIGKEFYKLKA
ncbi:MAG: nucleotidyltransferase domain-containing protein [Candidatus Kapabacteria bacterium]|nr:nucleotidyltransferase domain-containing protein [Candidatus Kapabacteria bacterium]